VTGTGILAAGPAAGTGLSLRPGRFHLLQALEDAIRYRRLRMAGPCAGCGPGGRCDDHGRDADLIAEYGQTARALGADAAGGQRTAWRATGGAS